MSVDMEPKWKSGPTAPSPSSSEHAIYPEDFGHGGEDFDGFGREEVESVEGDPLVVVMDGAVCSRDGCDAMHTRRLLFTTHTINDNEKDLLDSVSTEIPAYVTDHAKRVDDVTIEVSTQNDSTINITAERVSEDRPHGPCYGRIKRDPERL